METIAERELEDSVVTVQERLAKLQKVVRKATEDALKHANQGGVQPSKWGAVNIEDSNASFMLGMDLFGQEITDLERQVRENLENVELQLDEVLEQTREISCNNNDENRNLQVDQEPAELGESNGDANKNKNDPSVLASEAQVLQQKILFLKKCSLARSLVDESNTLSNPASSSRNSGGNPDVVEAAHRLLEAGDALESAESILNEEAESSGHSAAALQAGSQIVESIRTLVRRQRVDLVSNATSNFESAVAVTSSSISVKGSKQLQDAYDVLECLGGRGEQDSHDRNRSSFQSGASVLEDCIRNFCQSALMTTIFEPLFLPYRNLDSLDTPAVHDWKFSSTSDTPTATGLLGAAINSSKEPTYRLEWSRTELEPVPGGEPPNLDVSRYSQIVESWKPALDFVQQILQFVYERVLLQRKPLCDMMGHRLFGKPDALPSNLSLEALGLESTMLGSGDKGLMMETLFDLISKTCIPQHVDPTQLDKLIPIGKKLLSYCVPFCKDMADKSLIPLDPSKVPRLVRLCQNYEKNYVDNRRCCLLKEARDLLVNNDYHNTVVVGVDVTSKATSHNAGAIEKGLEVFHLHKSSISDTSSKLMAMVRKTMDEAVATQSAVATLTSSTERDDSSLALLPSTLYRTAREILGLFRAIIPASHGSEVAHVPRTAAVLHNDCVFLAHNCLTLGLEYKDKFPTPNEEDARGKLLKQTCMFVDMVPLFREMADRSMGDMLDRQKLQVADIVGTRITFLGKALKSDESLHEWSEAETALAAGIYHLRHLCQAWKPILSRSVFVRSIGYLADAIFTLYLNQVTSATAISASACHFCSTLFSKATDDIGSLLVDDDGFRDGNIFAKRIRSGDGILEGCSKEWNHFEAVGQMLHMNLAEIQTALANGVFRDVRSQELSRLILATFADSPKRQALLRTLANV